MCSNNTRCKSRLYGILVIFCVLLFFRQSAFASVEYVNGWVECGAPIDDVEIQVYDSNGKVLNSRPPQQSYPILAGESGVFSVAVENLPDRFRIKAQGGFCGDDMFVEMEAEVRNFDREEDLVHINPAKAWR